MKGMWARTWFSIFALALMVPAVRAQQKDPRLNPPTAPLPPVTVEESSSKPAMAGEERASNTAPAQTENRTLSGAVPFNWGIRSGATNTLVPTFQYFQFFDTNATYTFANPQFETISSFGGTVALVRNWDNYQLTASYGGTGLIHSQRQELNSQEHNFNILQKMTFRRWTLLLGNNFSYSPESPFGSGTGAALGGLGASVLNNLDSGTLGQGLVPSQTILTGLVRRVSNAFVGEADYRLSPRSTLTATASYAVLHYLDPGLLGTKGTRLDGGYNYQLTRRDTIGVEYEVNFIRFENRPEGINTHAVHLMYGRRLTGRLALDLSGGPSFTQLQLPGVQTGLQRGWTFGGGLRYAFRASDVNVSYHRLTTGGSGVLLGSWMDEIQFGYNRRLSRRWNGALSGGFARNARLAGVTTGPSEFSTWYASARATREVGRSMSLVLSYNFQRQTSPSPICFGTLCGGSFLRHYIGVGMLWHPRPIALE